jgi:hypothetical protein
MKTVNKLIKLAAVLLAAFVLAALFGTGTKVQAENKKVTTPGGLILEEVYDQITGNVYYVIGCTDKLPADLVIPEYYNDIPITLIDSKAFMDNTTLKSVTIPASVYGIRSRAFKNCTNLESVVFEGDAQKWRKEKWPKLDSVRKLGLGDEAFVGCTSLQSLELNYGWDTYGSNDRLLKNSGIKYLKLVMTDGYGQRDPDNFFNESPELEKLDIVIDRKMNFFNLGRIGDCPKLKEINIYEGDWATDYLCLPLMGNGGKVQNEEIANCPKLEYVNVYAPTAAPRSQFQSFMNADPETAFEGTNVKRLNNNGNMFEILGEGTTVFSCKEVPFKVRLIVGGGESDKKNLADCKLTIPVKELIYTGTARVPYLYLLDGKTLLEEDKDYKVEAKDNTEIGAATLTLTGIGDYAGTITDSFSIIPVRTDVKSVKIGKKESTIVLNDNKQADGYQIYYSSKKNKGFKKLYSGTDTKAKVTKLKSGMYIKVRTYKKVGKTTLYSEWSAPIQVK